MLGALVLLGRRTIRLGAGPSASDGAPPSRGERSDAVWEASDALDAEREIVGTVRFKFVRLPGRATATEAEGRCV
jgi:hypothetical protein